MHIFKSIYNGDICLEHVEKEQIKLKKDLGRIKQGDPKDKSSKQKKTINNIKNDCNGTRTHNYLVHKQTLNHLAKQAK